MTFEKSGFINLMQFQQDYMQDLVPAYGTLKTQNSVFCLFSLPIWQLTISVLSCNELKVFYDI